ncbi:hypothetical protein [Acinetobacter schindleri]
MPALVILDKPVNGKIHHQIAIRNGITESNQSTIHTGSHKTMGMVQGF